jgi:hypothetical protein
MASVVSFVYCLMVSFCWNLRVIENKALRVIENKARNLFSFIITGRGIKVSLGETMQMKNLRMYGADLVCYARTEFPSNMPNLETLAIGSHHEVYFFLKL